MAAGNFDEGLRRAEDYDLWLRLARSGAAIIYQRKVLLFRREMSTGLCYDKTLLFRNEVRVLAKLACGATLSREQMAMVAAQIERMKATIRLEEGKAAFQQRHFLEAALAIQAANRVYDSWKLRLVWLSLLLSPWLLLYVSNFLRRDRIPVPSEDLAG